VPKNIHTSYKTRYMYSLDHVKLLILDLSNNKLYGQFLEKKRIK
jgi:hypothetical protein